LNGRDKLAVPNLSFLTYRSLLICRRALQQRF